MEKLLRSLLFSLRSGRATIIISDASKTMQCCSKHFLFKYFRWISYTNMFYFSTFLKSNFSLFLNIIFSLKLVFIGNRIYFNTHTRKEIRPHMIRAICLNQHALRSFIFKKIIRLGFIISQNLCIQRKHVF